MKSAIFAQYNLFGANVYMSYDSVHLDNLSDISAYRNHNANANPVKDIWPKIVYTLSVT